MTPLEGIERQFPAAEVRYALGATYTAATPALVPSTFLAPPEGKEPGVLVEYFDNPDLQGEPRLRRSEPRPYFDMGMEDPAVVAAVGHEKYSVRWTATLTPPASGEYEVTVRTGMWNWTATARLFLDDKELTVGGGPSTQATSTQAAPGPRRPVRVRVALEAGRKYALRVEYRQTGAGGTIQLAWTPPADATLSEAEALAKGSDVAVVFVGLSSELEGEEMRGVNIPGFLGGDRTSLDLPEPQENAREGGHRDWQAGGRRPDQRQRRRRPLGRGGCLGRARGVVRRRGGRHGHRRDPGRGQQPGRPSSGDVLQERGAAARRSRTTP